MNETITLPFYAKLAFVLLSLIALGTLVYLGQEIIVPLLMALLFAILLRPLSLFFTAKLRLPHVIATILSVILFVLLFAVLIYVISIQVSAMTEDWNKIKQNVQIHYTNLQEFVSDRFNVDKFDQDKMIADAKKNSLASGKVIVGTTLSSFSGAAVNLILIPIYTFLILLYRTHFIKFLSKLFDQKYHETLRQVLGQIKSSVQSYIVGLMIEMVIVSVLTAIGFTIIGLKYAILLGLLTGLLNLIPYIGIMIALCLSIVASLTGSADLSIVLGIIIVNVIVQLVDNNLLVPMIVSSKVEINALISIVGIIVGGAIAGFSGMFLAIPLIAITKVIFDKIPNLEPWGYLMGDDLPKTYEWKRIRFPLFSNSTDTLNVEAEPSKSVGITEIYTKTTTHPDGRKD